MRPLIAVALLAAIAPAAPVPKSLKKPDVASQLVGTWKPNGQGSCWFQYNDDGTMKTWHVRNNVASGEMRWTWVLDPEPTSPRRIKVTRTSQPVQTIPAAIELDGDSLKFAFLNDKGMPEKLTAGSGFEFYDLVRSADGK